MKKLQKLHLVVGLIILGAVTLSVLNMSYVMAIVGYPTMVLTSISPVSGSTDGGTEVILTGEYFDASAVVTLGGANAAISSISPTTIVATTALHEEGSVDVSVTQTNNSSTLAGAYTYISAPPPPVDEGECNKKNKVTVCHLPPGNTDNPHTLCLPKQAIPAHLAHGDYLGVCS